jgi:RNA polymerase sigma factor (TIGR02999 family)
MVDDVTQILAAVENGDAAAAERLLPLVYDELRQLASHRMARERPGTLQATALVHEAYVRLLGPQPENAPRFDGSGHFFAAAAEAMRRILIERARANGREKRGGGRLRLDLDPDKILLDEVPDELLDLDAALDKLAEEDPVKAKLVTLRFFAGLTLVEAGAALGISSSTADRHWAYARAFLYDAMDGES